MSAGDVIPDVNTSFDFAPTISADTSIPTNSNTSFQFESENTSEVKTSLTYLENDIEEIIGTICGLQMKHKEMSIVFEQFEKLVKSSHSFTISSLQSATKDNSLKAIKLTSEIVLQKLYKYKSQYKRDKTYQGILYNFSFIKMFLRNCGEATVYFYFVYKNLGVVFFFRFDHYHIYMYNSRQHYVCSTTRKSFMQQMGDENQFDIKNSHSGYSAINISIRQYY